MNHFPGLLALIFVAAKLWGVIDWSWWWVLSPIWVSFIIALCFIAAGLWLTFRKPPHKHF